eukprot:GHVP01056631.1.p1 GENE.GHVP01056631.1~~GHVP01056631.1.p1  ORF type:complete len:183 (+),score=15.81 GHVP01056631.1:496-1044(+)
MLARQSGFVNKLVSESLQNCKTGKKPLEIIKSLNGKSTFARNVLKNDIEIDDSVEVLLKIVQQKHPSVLAPKLGRLTWFVNRFFQTPNEILSALLDQFREELKIVADIDLLGCLVAWVQLFNPECTWPNIQIPYSYEVCSKCASGGADLGPVQEDDTVSEDGNSIAWINVVNREGPRRAGRA